MNVSLELLTAETIALGFQHYILALGTAVMIPSFLVSAMGGSDVSKLFLCSSPFNYFSLFCCFDLFIDADDLF